MASAATCRHAFRAALMHRVSAGPFVEAAVSSLRRALSKDKVPVLLNEIDYHLVQDERINVDDLK